MASELVNVGDGAGDQFKAEMLMQHPFTIAYGVCMGVAVLGQRDAKILFMTPGMLRQVGGDLLQFADQWERGEIEGLKKPGKEKRERGEL